MEYWCQKCEKAFTSEEKRCPTCLRMSTVVEKGKAQSKPARPDSGKDDPPSIFRGPGLLVTLAILVPLMVLNRMEWGLGWWFTLVAAIIGFGAGHLVNWFWQKRKQD